MDFLSLGIDVSSWDAGKEQTLQRFINLFTKLEQFDGKTFNPILGGGLAEFNTAATNTSKLLDELNEKLKNFKTNTDTSKSSTTGLTEAEKLLAKQTADYNALLAKLNALTTDQAKANMAAKLELSLMTKQMLEQAKAGNVVIQQQVAQKKAISDLAKSQKDAATAKREADLKTIRDQRDLDAAIRKKAAAARDDVRATQQESAANKILTNDLLLLKKAFQDQSVRYGNSFINNGKNAPETKSALADLNATGAIIGTIEGKINNATGSSKLFGGALSSIFSQVRTLAYILPGIGIAGIFNLAFEAIGKAVGEMGAFNDQTQQWLKSQIAINKTLEETLKLNEQIYSLNKLLSETPQAEREVTGRTTLDIVTARGFDATQLAQRKADLAAKGLEQTTADIIGRGSAPETLKSELDRKLDLMRSYAKSITKIQNEIDSKDKPGRKQPTDLEGNPLDIKVKNKSEHYYEQKKLEKERVEGLLKLAQEEYDVKSGLLTKYNDLVAQSAQENAALVKLHEDELRRIKTETAKENISTEIDANKKILENDISSYEQKREAIKRIGEEEKRLSKVERDNITSNISSSPADIEIANSVYSNSKIKTERDTNKKLIDLKYEYDQRFLKAETEINKSILNEEAIKNEKIANNEENNLSERLVALSKYFKARQDMQSLEEKKDLTQRSLLAGGAVPKRERDEITRLSNEQKANIVADAEKKVYDIVYQSTRKRLQLIKDTNALEDGEDKEKYTAELKKLNESFENKEINYKKWKLRRAEIDNQFSRLSIVGAIKDDKSDLDRLEGVVETSKRGRDAASKKVGLASDQYSAAPGLGTKQDYDEAVGEYKAFNDSVLDAEKEAAVKREKLRDDELKLQLKRYEKEKDTRKDMLKALSQIENAVYDTVRTIGDSQYEDRINRIQEMEKAIEEQYNSEIDAIDKSSLSAKDKAALDIQINAQKIQSARTADLEQKKIAHDKAVFDKQLAETHIILSTAEAVAALLESPWLAIAAGAAGAAELVKVENTKIPSYSEGTGNHPGGVARVGEAGVEKIKEPYKSPYYVMEETIGYLPKGTVVTPIDESPNFPEKVRNNMEPFVWLARQLKPKSQRNIFNPTINVDLGFEQFKFKRLYGK